MAIAYIDPINSKPLYLNENGLADEKGNVVYPFLNGVFRLADAVNYTANFGFEWNEFQKTQLDKFSGNSLSQERFFKSTGWKREMAGENILEVGSGAGRFSQIVLDHTNACLYTVDYSNAVDANFRNNGPNERMHIFQASIYQLPFKAGSFDKVFCFGVLQHTPDFRKSIECLIEMVKPGGELVVDFYPIKGWYTKINSKYLFRPVLKKMSNERLLKMIRRNIGWLMRLYYFHRKIGLSVLNRFLPICEMPDSISKTADRESLKEWFILDTFDMYSPAYDRPQKITKVADWFKESGMQVVQAGLIPFNEGYEAAVVRGVKPLTGS